MRLNVRLDLTTPAFLGAARTRQVDRYFLVRPSAVRGALREWFRMGAAAVLWPQPDTTTGSGPMLDSLRKAEREIFGGVHGEAVRSRLIVSTSGGAWCRITPPDASRWPGTRYLGYGLFDGQQVPEALVTGPARGWVCDPAPATAQPVTLRLELRRRGPRDHVPAGIERLVCASLWLWTHLGGLGARVRRGFGSLRVAPPEGLPWPAQRPAASRADLAQQLVDGIEWATAQFREALPLLGCTGLEAGSGPHPSLRTLDGIDQVRTLPFDGPDAFSVLDHAGRLFRDFRSTLQRGRLGLPPLPDYFSVKHGLEQGQPPRSVDRAAFGLPLPFYFRSLGGKKTTFRPAAGDRLASPLLFRVHALADGRYAVVLVDLGERAESGPLAGMSLVQDASPQPIPAPDGRLIRDFIAWANEQARRSPPSFGEGAR